MSQSESYWVKFSQNESKRVTLSRNESKRVKMGQIRSKWVKMNLNNLMLVENCQKESKQIVASGAFIVKKMSQILQNESKFVKARRVEIAASTVYAALQKIESNLAKCVRIDQNE